MKDKYMVYVKQYIAPLLLLLLPLRHITQGIDISDTGYNLACFRWFGELDGMWVYVTYLANVVGHGFTLLPFGDTMAGMNLYCSLVVSLTALLAWFFLKDKLPFILVLAGEILAIFLCWCPHVILYNYLTYLGLTAGTILLYGGIRTGKKFFLVSAGFLLGLGVGTRFSNLTHMALILALWYDSFLKKKNWKNTVRDTLWCILGYAAGLAVCLLMIWMQYGLSGYFGMLFGLQEMSGGAGSGYSMGEMIAGAFLDYAGSMRWGILFFLYALAGVLLFRVRQGQYDMAKKILFLAGLAVWMRLLYGRGMFGFDYHTYFSIFWWVSLFNTTALVCSIAALFSKKTSQEEKVLAMLVLITILILPLGSNNRSYPVINDLFLIGPVTLYFIWKFLPHSFPLRSLFAGCLLVFAVQSVGFGMVFVFRDGSFDEKRDTKVENNGILKGMYTTKANAQALTEITAFWQESVPDGKQVILYGDIPGLSYLLDAPPAITSTWANLESYNMTFWQRDFGEVEKQIKQTRPIVIRGRDYATIGASDAEKNAYLDTFLDRYGYREIFKNEKVIIYE